MKLCHFCPSAKNIWLPLEKSFRRPWFDVVNIQVKLRLMLSLSQIHNKLTAQFVLLLSLSQETLSSAGMLEPVILETVRRFLFAKCVLHNTRSSDAPMAQQWRSQSKPVACEDHVKMAREAKQRYLN